MTITHLKRLTRKSLSAAVPSPSQGLQSLGCVRKSFLRRQPVPSLFSSPSPAEETAAPKLSEAAAAFYEPTLDCTIKLGRVFPYELNWNKWVQAAPP